MDRITSEHRSWNMSRIRGRDTGPEMRVHNGCANTSMPNTRRSFWEQKLSGNVARDRRVKRELRKLGWHVLTVWECELDDEERIAGRFLRILSRWQSQTRRRRSHV